MTKRQISLLPAFLLIFAAVVLLAAVGANAAGPNEIASGSCGENASWVLYDNGLLRISGTGEMTFYTYASDVPWHQLRSSITAVEMEDSVTTLGPYAFSGCVNLTTASISSSAAYIGNYAFDGCTALTGITIPDSAENIGMCAFRNCSSLRSVSIGSGVTVINDCAFDCCGSLSSVKMGGSVKQIGGYSFSGCESLSNIEIPNGVTEIGSGAFFNCSGLKRLYLPDSLTSIGGQAFMHCDGLETVHTGNGITSLSCFTFGESLKSIEIGSGVTSLDVGFSHCTNLSHVGLGRNITSIGDGAFECCTSLAEIDIPDGVREIGASAFYGCTKLSSITLPAGLTEISNNLFQGCTNLAYVTIHTATRIGCAAFEDCSSLLYITIPGDATEIGSDAFRNCTSLRRLEIPDRVVSVGNSVTEGCESLEYFSSGNGLASLYGFSFGPSLKEAVIGDQVTSLPRGIFNLCTNLTDVNIPSGVTHIPGNAFSNCSSLKNIIIPDGVTDIGESAFASCTNLTGIDIPDSVTEIGNGAFESCTGLARVNFGKGLQKIGNSAFCFCKNLTCVSLPNGLTEIGDTAFMNCLDLECVVIPASVVKIGYWAFYRYPGACYDIFYGGSQTQWGQIRLDKELHNGVLFSAGEEVNFHYGHGGAQQLGDTIPGDGYLIHVVDSEYHPIAKANVCYGAQSGTTNGDGDVLFDKITVGDPVVKAYKVGFESFNSGRRGDRDRGAHSETVVLYTAEESGFRLKYAKYFESADRKKCCDLLKEYKTVNLQPDVNGYRIGSAESETFYLDCKANSSFHPEYYELWQGSTLIAESKDGQFTLQRSQFSEGGGCYIRAVSMSHGSYNTNLKLAFERVQLHSDPYVSLTQGDVTVTVPDSVPLLGGSSFQVGLPKLPVDFYFSSDTVYIGLNCQLCSEEDRADSKSFSRWWNKQKNTVEQIKTLHDLSRTLTANTMREVLKEDEMFKLPGGSFKAYIFGYAEGNLNENAAHGKLCILVDAKTPTGGCNFFVWSIPATVHFSGHAKAEAGLEVSYDWDTAQFLYNGVLNPTVGVEVFGGLGTGELFGAGVYGYLDVISKLEAFGTTEGVQLKTVDAVVEAGVRAYLACFTYQNPFYRHTWNLYPGDDLSLQSVEAPAWNEAPQFRMDDFSYLSAESEWLGEQVSLMDDPGKMTVSPLLTDTYNNAQPTMVSGKDGLYAAFVRADTGGKSYVAVTKYDGSSWAEPITADAAAICDNAPALCAAADGTIWLAYTKTDAGFDGETLLSFAQNQSIVVGTVDPDTLAFTEKAEWSGEGYLRSPKLTLVNGVPELTWLSSAVNTDSQVILPPAAAINASAWNGSAWSEAAVLTQADRPVIHLCPGVQAGKLLVGYVADADGSLTTDADRALYTVQRGAAPKKVAEGVAGRPVFAVMPGQIQAGFCWNAADALCAADGTRLEVPGITDEYAIVGDTVYYSAATGGSANLMAVRVNADGSRSEAVQLTGEERYLENLSVVCWDGSPCALALETGVSITKNSVEMRRDLVWLSIGPVRDLRLDRLECDPDELAAGGQTAVTVSVTNAGSCDVSAFTVLLNGETAARGGALRPGESAEIPITLTCPSELAQYSVSVISDDAGEYTPENNSASFALGYADLSVTLVSEAEGAVISAEVTNLGISAAGGKLELFDEAGKLLAERTLPVMESGESCIVRCPLPDAGLLQNGGEICANLTCDQEEVRSENNVAWVSLPKRENEIRITNFDEENRSFTLQVENTGSIAAVACAFYNEAGQLLSFRTETPAEGESCFDYQADGSAAMAKVFLWDADYTAMLLEQEILFPEG